MSPSRQSSGRHKARKKARKPWTPRRIAGASLIGLAVAALVGIATLHVISMGRELERAQALVTQAGAAIENGDVGTAQRLLRQADESLLSVNRGLHGRADIEVLASVPGIGGNVRSLRSTVDVALTLVTGGQRILAAAEPLQDPNGHLEVSLDEGSVPLPAIAAVREAAVALRDDLATVQPVSRTMTISRLADVEGEIIKEAVRRRQELGQVIDGLDVITELTGGNGDRRILLAISNIAEMRGTGGMILNYGILESSGGRVTLGDFGRIDELELPGPLPGAREVFAPDFLARWGGFDVTQRWRNVNVGADFEEAGPSLLAFYRYATDRGADAVIQIDPAGLAAMLDVVGPVQIPELGRVDADNVVDLVLNEAYRRFPDVEQRSDVLGDVARATFDRLVTGAYPSLRTLADNVVETAHQRHLALYSTDTGVQSIAERAGATAGLPAADTEYVHLGVQNTGGDKLDYYVDTALAISGVRRPDEPSSITATIQVTNNAPAGVTTPRYIFGPPDRAGVYRGVVSLYLPVGTGLQGGDHPGVVNPPAMFVENGRTVLSYTIEVPPGGTSTVAVELRLPPRSPGPYSLAYVPSPRIRPTSLFVDLDSGEERIRYEGEPKESVEIEG